MAPPRAQGGKGHERHNRDSGARGQRKSSGMPAGSAGVWSGAVDECSGAGPADVLRQLIAVSGSERPADMGDNGILSVAVYGVGSPPFSSPLFPPGTAEIAVVDLPGGPATTAAASSTRAADGQG